MRHHLLFNCFTVCLFVLLSASAHGTRNIPPTLPEIVEGSRHIGLVKLRKSEVYDVVDSEGVVPCGIIYEGVWVDSLTGDVGSIEFRSNQTLEVRGLYLVYLAGHLLPRKLMSTNSRSEAQRSNRIAREQLCERTQNMPRTIFTSSKFVNEESIADEYKTGIWVEYPHFSDSALEEIVIMPTELSISGELISRDQLLDEFFDENKHQVIRTAGYSLFIFKAVNWIEYCTALVALASTKSNRESATNSPRHSFCEPKTGVIPPSQ